MSSQIKHRSRFITTLLWAIVGVCSLAYAVLFMTNPPFLFVEYSTGRHYPWSFALACGAIASITCPAIRGYSRNRWQIPLSHVFTAVLAIGILFASATLYLSVSHSHETLIDTALGRHSKLNYGGVREMLVFSLGPITTGIIFGWLALGREQSSKSENDSGS